MIHYYVWFSFQSGATESENLGRVRTLLGDLVARGLVKEFTLLRNKATGAATRLLEFHAAIVFADGELFARSFRDVADAGIRSGSHGLMIANVKDFIAEVFEELPSPEDGPSETPLEGDRNSQITR